MSGSTRRRGSPPARTGACRPERAQGERFDLAAAPLTAS